ncbi:MAG: hypothetical protein HQL94_04025 [Magnetococcales bacterium]|nr:hypothetical protein [Magnetococcales bacterium]
MQLVQLKKNKSHSSMPPIRPNTLDPEFHMLDNESTRTLWAAVLERAILDLKEHGTREEAVAWINSKRHSVGSFLWVCHQLDMDPSSVKRALLGQKFCTTH